MAVDWKEYQEEAAAFFRSLGLDAATDQSQQGVRTRHDIDVLVEIDVAGHRVKWIVECKHWKNNVSKLHVMALREIVNDLGADRGIILCETGFQRGAVEAANSTGALGYTGPCPPAGTTHTYLVTVHYLGQGSGLEDGETGTDMITRIQQISVATAESSGTFSRP